MEAELQGRIEIEDHELVLRDIYTPNEIKCKLVCLLVIKRVG